MRPFSGDDESLDVRGRALVTSSSAPITSSTPASAAAHAYNDNDSARVTSPAGDTDKPATTKKTRKKRRSSRKSEGEEITIEHVDEGVIFQFCEVTIMLPCGLVSVSFIITPPLLTALVQSS